MRLPERRRTRGFTLVEVLVALLIMAVLAAMSWQGIDAIVRSRDASAQRLEQQLRLQSVISQWETDLGALQDSGAVPALQFDGAALRLTRRNVDGLQLVIWSLRGGSWTRWASPPLTHRVELQQWWVRSQQFIGNEAEQLRALTGVASWQLYYWRGNSWSNAQSSGNPTPVGAGSTLPGGAGLPPAQSLPEGVRLLLTFAEGSGVVGAITRDVQVKL